MYMCLYETASRILESTRNLIVHSCSTYPKRTSPHRRMSCPVQSGLPRYSGSTRCLEGLGWVRQRLRGFEFFDGFRFAFEPNLISKRKPWPLALHAKACNPGTKSPGIQAEPKQTTPFEQTIEKLSQSFSINPTTGWSTSHPDPSKLAGSSFRTWRGRCSGFRRPGLLA